MMANAHDKSLESWIWDAACSIRGAQEAPKFKDFILPLIFTKRLCDVFDDELKGDPPRRSAEPISPATAFRGEGCACRRQRDYGHPQLGHRQAETAPQNLLFCGLLTGRHFLRHVGRPMNAAPFWLWLPHQSTKNVLTGGIR